MVKRVYSLIGLGAILSAAVVQQSKAFEVRSPSKKFPSARFAVGRTTAKRESILAAVAVKDRYGPSIMDEPSESSPSLKEVQDDSFLGPVLSAALLITGNTVGAGSLVLPSLCSGPGLAASSGVFLMAYVMNLISGLVLAEVAIKQKESSPSGEDVPSSFKEFAQVNLNSHAAATGISAISLFVNACVLAFDLSRAGSLGETMLGIPSNLVSVGWAGAFATLVTTQSSANLSKVASTCVSILFLSFGGLLLPGLASVSDPVGTFLQPGTSENLMGSLSEIAPIILMSMIYQNVVPSVTKILNYDRTRTVSAIVLGSLLPLLMYCSWCYACMGGGIDCSIVGAGGGGLMTAFSLATLMGSSLGSIMSLAEEVDTFMKPEKSQDDGFQLSSVLASVGVPLAAAATLANGEDFTAALAMAGSFGSPLLYGVLPAIMAWNQRKENAQPQPSSGNLVPAATLPILGFLSTTFVGEEVFQRVGEAVAFVS